MIGSLGPGAGADALAALVGGGALAGRPSAAQFALTVGAAGPAAPPVELAVAGYARQGFTFVAGGGLWSNDVGAAWSLPEETVIGGVIVVNTAYASLANPLAWLTLDQPVTILNDLAFAIPAGGFSLRGFLSD